MLTQIDLRHFKCFKRLQLPLRPLTLLSGTNASGKSSVLQALALLHQTMREHEWSYRLMLNGSAIRLGTAADVIDRVHGHNECGIALHDGDETRVEWEFAGEREEMAMVVRRSCGEISDGTSWDTDAEGMIWGTNEGAVQETQASDIAGATKGMGWGADGMSWDIDESKPLHCLLPFSMRARSPNSRLLTDRLRGLTYLTAERQGPRESYPLDDPQLAPVVGPNGEHAVSIVHLGRDALVLDGLRLQEVPPHRFRQVEARMGSFFPGCALAINQVPHASAVTLGIRASRGTDFYRPTHTGFGLTQVLPIVVASLSAGRDDLLLIENPEVHLHPAGQVAMGKFLAEVAEAGVQVIIETHSDHVLNGIRRAVKSDAFSSDSVALHFFRPRDDRQQDLPQIESLCLDDRGNVDRWPEGFFDQFDKDMHYFAGWEGED